MSRRADPAPEPVAPTPWNRGLVTGATAGIGKEIATQLAASGTDLVLVARDEVRLKALAAKLETDHGVDAEVLVADLSLESGRSDVIARLVEGSRPIDLLVNNAGLGHQGNFVDLDIDAASGVVEVNVVALHQLCHAAGRTMAARGRGAILNVSSVAAYYPSPQSATYAATKAFVTSLSEALHVELADRGVVVTCLAPGLTRTEFHQRASADVSEYPQWLWQEAETVAAVGLAALAAGKVTVVPGTHNKLFKTGLQLTPAALRRRLEKTIDQRTRLQRVPCTTDRLE